MTWRHALTHLRKSVLPSSQDARDLEDVIRFHLEQEAQLREDRGASAEDARQAARRSF